MNASHRRPSCPSARLRRAAAIAVLAASLALLAGAAPAATGKEAPDAKAAPPPAAAIANVMGSPEEHPSFSVDMVVKSQGQTIAMTRSVDHGKSRMVMKFEGMEVVQILLDDEAGTTYTLMPKEKRGMKQTRAATEGVAKDMAKGGGEEAAPETPSAEVGAIERVGQETIDGHPADKYKVTFPEGAAFMWIDPERNLPLRMKSNDAEVEFRNYRFEPQPAELFQPPGGYEITDMDAMMKMNAGGMGGMSGMGAMAGGMAKGWAGSMGANLGGSLGGSIGGALGGPIGSLVGRFVGQKLGSKIGSAAAGAVLPGK